MKNLALKHPAGKPLLTLLLLAAIVLCGSARTTFSQKIENSTPTAAPQTEAELRRVELIEALERAQTEVVAGRKYVAALEEQIRLKQERINALGQRDEFRAAKEAALLTEINELKAAIVAKNAAQELAQTQIARLDKDLKKTQKKLRAANRRTRWVIVGAAIFAVGAIVSR